MKWIVSIGNPFDGLTFEGPFDSADEAVHYGQEMVYNNEWNVVPMDPPDPDWEYN